MDAIDRLVYLHLLFSRRAEDCQYEIKLGLYPDKNFGSVVAYESAARAVLREIEAMETQVPL